jgi:hypothetical protein
VAFVTRDEALRASRSTYGYLAEAELGKSARTSSTSYFDIFLSHSREDAEIVAGVKALLEREGLSVYVDWIEDPQLDRSRVSAATADQLRNRMKHSNYLLYASSRASSHSKWMPWELGYFDGRRSGKVGILPIVDRPGDRFVGVEYLGLYPLIERVSYERFGTQFGEYTTSSRAARLKTMAQS